MKVFHDEFELATSGQSDVRDITDMVRSKVRATGIQNGLVAVFVTDATAAVTTLECERGAIEDLRRAMARLVPTDADYARDEHNDEHNGFSYIRAALLGPSLTIPVGSSKILLGTWQQIVFCEFDNKSHTRTVSLLIMGE